METNLKKLRLVATGFFCGFLFCAALVLITEKRKPAMLSSGPVLASSQVAVPIFRITLTEQSSPGIIQFQRRDDMRPPPGAEPAHDLHLIDMRHQPLREIQ